MCQNRLPDLKGPAALPGELSQLSFDVLAILFEQKVTLKFEKKVKLVVSMLILACWMLYNQGRT